MNITDDAFIDLLASKKLAVNGDLKSLNSLRVMLYRKLQAHIQQWDDVGYLSDELKDTTVTMKYAAGVGVFSIVKRKPRLQFTIIRPEVETHDSEVPADLEHNQDSSVQYGSASENPQEHGSNTHPSCPQGESNGQRSAEEDWQSKLREFIESHSTGSEAT